MSSSTPAFGVLIWPLVFVIRLYQWALSPVLRALGASCRFEPSCSEYAVGALKRYGCLRGLFRAARRILRCHPGYPGGGYDPP